MFRPSNLLSAAAFLAAAFLTIAPVNAAETADTVRGVSNFEAVKRYLPKVGAAIRVRYEYDTQYDAARFQVRNARLRMYGSMIPQIEYFMQADFCLQGKFSMLDAYVGFVPDSHWKICVGQSRVPFSPDATRAPGNYLFVNRSFIGRYFANQRSVGVKACYSAGGPLYIEGGVFNSASIGNHSVWGRHYTYGIKARYTFAGMLTPEIGFKSDVPVGGVRTNLLSTALTWRYMGWLAEAEYVRQTYSHGRFKDCHGFNFMAQYAAPVKFAFFNRWSGELRYDGMTDHSNSVLSDDGHLVCDDIGRRRFTAGTTLSYYRGSTHLDLCLNYEQYFYPDGYRVPDGAGNKLVTEVILFF